MDGRLLLILCLGLLQIYVPGSIVNGQTQQSPPRPTVPASTEKPRDWCILNVDLTTNNLNVLRELDTLPKEGIVGCEISADAKNIRCNLADKKIDDCKVEYLNIANIPDSPKNETVRTQFADWFLRYQVCIWQFPLNMWWQDATRATTEHFNYDKSFSGCRVEKNKNTTVCLLKQGLPCLEESVKMADIIAMPETPDCNEDCLSEQIADFASRFKICHLKFEFDAKTSSVTLKDTANLADYREIPKLLDFTDCFFSANKTIFFCRGPDNHFCTSEFYEGNVVLNFFDSLELGKEVTTKMMHSVLKSDICLWRLTYEVNEYKGIHFDDYGHRLKEYEYREKLDLCRNEKKLNMATCVIPQRPCEFGSIQRFSFSKLVGSDDKLEDTFIRARNRFGPCFAEFKHANCMFNETRFTYFSEIHRHFERDTHCAFGENGKSINCWATEEQMERMEFQWTFGRDEKAKCWKVMNSTGEFFQSLTRKWKELHGSGPNQMYHVFVELQGDVDKEIACDIVNYKVEIATEVSCFSSSIGSVLCFIPSGTECSPNYFINGNGAEEIFRLPSLSSCSKENFTDYLEDLWPTSGDSGYYKIDKPILSTIDPYAFINNPAINSSGEIMYPPVEIEFKDPPSKEEIKARREALTGRKNETKENNMGKRLSVLSWSVLLPLQFFFL